MEPDECFSIGIVGAGISGMTLAAIVAKQMNKAKISVFERDSRNRDQGTGFDIHKKGQQALKKAGVFHKYSEFSRSHSDIFQIYKLPHNKPRFVLTTPKLLHAIIPPTPESNRELLREALIDSFGNQGTIEFECKVSRVRMIGKQVELLGENEISLGIFDLVVDASGISSSLRSFRINEVSNELRFQGYYTGMSMVHGLISCPEDSCDPEIVQKLGEGTMLTLDGGRVFCLQRYGASKEDKRASVYYLIHCETMNGLYEKFGLKRTTKFFDDDIKLNPVKEWILNDMGDDFTKDYKSAIYALEMVAIRPLYQHPSNPKFIDDQELPLILIGDALHAVPPYTGSGGNLALEDAAELADYLTKNKKSSMDIPNLRNLEFRFLSRAVPVMKEGNQTRDSYVRAAEMHKNGKKQSDLDIMGGSILFYLFAWLFTLLYRIEQFFHSH